MPLELVVFLLSSDSRQTDVIGWAIHFHGDVTATLMRAACVLHPRKWTDPTTTVELGDVDVDVKAFLD